MMLRTRNARGRCASEMLQRSVTPSRTLPRKRNARRRIFFAKCEISFQKAERTLAARSTIRCAATRFRNYCVHCGLL